MYLIQLVPLFRSEVSSRAQRGSAMYVNTGMWQSLVDSRLLVLTPPPHSSLVSRRAHPAWWFEKRPGVRPESGRTAVGRGGCGAVRCEWRPGKKMRQRVRVWCWTLRDGHGCSPRAGSRECHLVLEPEPWSCASLGSRRWARKRAWVMRGPTEAQRSASDRQTRAEH